MKSNEYRKIQVNITTYKKDNFKEPLKNMNEDKNRRNYQTNLNNKFICSICLNSKAEDKVNEKCKSNSKACPICQRNCAVCIEKDLNKTEKEHNETLRVHKTKNIIKEGPKKTETKSVQTIQTDLNKSLNLLNEVLTVFQSKKIDQVKSKTVILKDASVSTSNIRTFNSKLSISKVFQFSIDQNGGTENGKFIVMSSKINSKRSNIDLIKNKSSSIPQMKIEELKHSLKEKTKSKDAIEEVNRMFATVRKNYYTDDLNRPSIRCGPRILPVVETVVDYNEKFIRETETKINKKHSYKCCQTSCMSSGDSIKCCHTKESDRCDKTQCCHLKESGRCEKCVYMLCCHYNNCRQTQAGVMICERCRDAKEMPWKYSERSFEDSG